MCVDYLIEKNETREAVAVDVVIVVVVVVVIQIVVAVAMDSVVDLVVEVAVYRVVEGFQSCLVRVDEQLPHPRPQSP
jgi:hypothetical protein